MVTIKLSEWCEKSGVKYLTAYRWFKANKFPVPAYQTQSGTILVEEDPVENLKNNEEVASLVFKKTVELSKANGSIEDFAAWTLSNFKLERQEDNLNTPIKNTEKITQNHFKKFMKQGKQKPETQSFLVNESKLDEVMENSAALSAGLIQEIANPQTLGTVVSTNSTNLNSSNLNSMVSDMTAAMRSPIATPQPYTFGEIGAVFSRSVDDGTLQFSTLDAAVSNSVTTFENANTAFCSPSAASSYVSGMTFTASSIPDSNISTFYASAETPTPMNEVNLAQPYNPVTYDEARALVSVMNKGGDPMAIDRQAKEICKLNRDTYEMMLSLAETKRT